MKFFSSIFIDTFKIWKYGKSIRVDYNLVGVKNLKAKKRDISIIFNPTNNVLEREDVKEFNQDEMANVLWLLNNSHKTFTNPLVCFLFFLYVVISFLFFLCFFLCFFYVFFMFFYVFFMFFLCFFYVFFMFFFIFLFTDCEFVFHFMFLFFF